MNTREDFAPYWLASSILDDLESSAMVQEFLAITYKDIHGMNVFGGLINRNVSTQSMHEAADRYSSIAVFLASIWTRPDEYVMTGRAIEQEIDVSFLRQQVPTDLFKHVQRIGEKAYQKEKANKNTRLECLPEALTPTGRYVWVWEETEPTF
jgi:hypothetical protein